MHPDLSNPTGRSNAGFNNVVGRIHVILEHGFGHLKCWFLILSLLPIILKQDDKSMREILSLIDTCVVLHNFILSHNENQDEPFFYTPRLEGSI